jgi:hypothetical protein
MIKGLTTEDKKVTQKGMNRERERERDREKLDSKRSEGPK